MGDDGAMPEHGCQPPRAGYRLLIFDFDGTLADTFPFFLRTMDVLADEFGFRRIGAHEVDGLRGCGARQMLRHVGLPLWKMPRVAARFIQLMSARIDEVALFDGIDRLLPRLAAHGCELAVVTSNSRDNVRRVLGEDTDALFAHHECGAAIFGKRARLERVVRRSGVAREQVLCIGDELRDAEAARAAGLAFGAVGWGYTRLDALRAHAPEVVFERVEDIAGHIIAATPAA
jgi:phosphoglycolate phosphatase